MSAPADKDAVPRRPAMSDVALALASRRSEPVSTVKITDANARGIVQIDVSVAAADPTVAAEQASAVYDSLREKYPRPDGDA